MLMPKRVKHRKQFRGRMKGTAHRGNFVSNGDIGLAALEPCWVTSQQIEAARVALTRYTKRGGQVWIKIFPDKPVTQKPAETRMGSGKGSPEYWVAVVKPGRILFDTSGRFLLLSQDSAYTIGSKSAAPCLQSGQTKSSGSSSPSCFSRSV